MNLFFWKKPVMVEPPVKQRFDHHRLLVEKGSDKKYLSPLEFEKQMGIVYLPRLDFQSWTDFSSISRKIAKFHEKGYLTQQQLWLGAYFQKEILGCEVPPVALRWIDDEIGWGVFSLQDLKPMALIGEYTGQVRRKNRSDAKNAYCFQYSIISSEPTRYAIDARNQGGITRFINHSDTPNLGSALATCHNLSHIVLFTKKQIRKGEQICYDYGSDYWAKRSKPRTL
ncbi:MAG: seT domain protein [Parachlamydiales bacterium]|nr:seT domain protein [Parachlamydiales bacterium]